MFLYRLALEIGEWDVEQSSQSLSARMTLEQLRVWMAFYRIEPFGQPWWRSARLAATVGAMWTGKYQEKVEETFMPTYREARPQSDQEMLAELMKAPQFRKQLEKQGR